VSHAASAIQKTVSEIVANHCQPVSTAIAYVADEYIPSGNTVGQPTPAYRRTVTYTNNGIHSVATIHVTIVTARTPSVIGPGNSAW